MEHTRAGSPHCPDVSVDAGAISLRACFVKQFRHANAAVVHDLYSSQPMVADDAAYDVRGNAHLASDVDWEVAVAHFDFYCIHEACGAFLWASFGHGGCLWLVCVHTHTIAIFVLQPCRFGHVFAAWAPEWRIASAIVVACAAAEFLH